MPVWPAMLSANRRRRMALVAAALGGASTIAWACADSSCGPSWRLVAPSLECAGRAAISPGNDSRINLLLLIRSLGTGSAMPVAYPKPDWDNRQFGHSFLDWKGLRAALWPQPETSEAKADETPASDAAAPCDVSAASLPAFTAAVAGEPGLAANDRKALTSLRAKLGCTPIPANAAMPSAVGRDYLAYLRASEAFYANQWPLARQGFAALAQSPSGWIAETAAYMPIRIGLRAAVAGATGEYGDFAGVDKVDAKAVAEARAGISAYLAAYPKGRYAASAQGLTRRVLWLENNRTELARAYERLLTTTPAKDEALADLVEEVDVHLLGSPDVAAAIAKAGDTPHLLAIADLMAMRPAEPDKPMALTAANLAAQQGVFAGRADLFSFLDATRAFYAGDDAKTVLTLIPDAARDKAYTPLAFSRQMLRGMALAKAKDPAEAGFWRDLLGGADPVYQRPLVEMGLAMRWQHEGRLDLVFAPGSPITDAATRQILAQTMASPALLRINAANMARPAHEREITIFTLLYKDLSRGAYADFTRDMALVPAKANTDAGLWDFAQQDKVPLGLFTQGKWSAGFACPALVQTAATLAKTPGNQQALICLGEFWRLNGFDGFSLFHNWPYFDSEYDPNALGNGPDGFPGKPLTRSAIYDRIIADRRAAPHIRAYALYRAIQCYAPSGSNGCAGPFRTSDEMEAAQAPKDLRRSWFQELKKTYPTSPWAKQLRFYW